MKFVLLVEGATEKGGVASFLQRWLDPQLTSRIGIKVVNCRGNTRLVQELTTKAQDYLDGPTAAEIVAVVGLLDLYGLDIYPRDSTTAKDRHAWAVRHFQAKVNRDKFRMFFAVHELEAWILGQPEVLPRAVQEALPDSSLANPEKVNFHEPPAKLLNRVYLSQTRKGYKKTTYGQQLFRKLSPQTVAEKCPYLKAMLTEMLGLAKAADL